MVKIWKHYWNTSGKKMLLDAGLLVLFLYVFNGILAAMHVANTYYPWDPLHDFWEASDWSFLLFLLTYGGLFAYLWINRKNPQNIHAYIRAYAMLVFCRSITVYFFPFRPSEEALPLHDPILNTFFYPNGYSPFDLFFSGHAATLFLFGVFTIDQKLKWVFYTLGVFVGSFLIAQKVHYTLDVVFAPVFAWIIGYFTKWSLKISTKQ
jgi:hypothetical protein